MLLLKLVVFIGKGSDPTFNLGLFFVKWPLTSPKLKSFFQTLKNNAFNTGIEIYYLNR